MTADAIPPPRKRSPGAVRASKDGHAYHEAWAARSALELLPPDASLQALAIEGFSVDDDDALSAGATEIADVVRYHGGTEVARASRVEVVQFKYSIVDADTPIRAADLAKTLVKFAATDIELRALHGDELVDRVVRYDFATNRPPHPGLLSAIGGVVSGAMPAEEDVRRQADQLEAALRGHPLGPARLLSRLEVSGRRGSLREIEVSLQQMLAAWGEATDPESERRLLRLRNLIRTKAGSEGFKANLVDRVAVLAELGVDHERDLYPTPAAFPPVPNVVPRDVTGDIVGAATSSAAPLVLHGEGGSGKTVLMQAVGHALRATHRVVMFDGFGAGAWRDPADGRERPQRTLLNLANLLAAEGLCDILLPIGDETLVLRAFRRRLEQSVATARQSAPKAGVALLLDAIDHSAIQAQAMGTKSFAHLLLQTLAVSPIDGILVIASCRTERLADAVGGAAHRPFPIPVFSPQEARQLIFTRDRTCSAVEVDALVARSGCNPRYLDGLLVAGRPYDGPAPGEERSAGERLNALLRDRVEAARREAIDRGATREETDTLLSGLALLPPPVPIAELAAAHNMSEAQVHGFLADLAPLTERTPHGVMFRDEPTETLIRSMSELDPAARERIVGQLKVRQAASDYAARALPSVLTSLDRVDDLTALGFDERAPPGASKVSLRNIRLARLVSALDANAKAGRLDDLIRLLLEASLVAAGHERSDRFLYEHPDLAAVSGDAEALRRLFETRVGWPGGRHSALALANAFGGEMGEARRNARRAIDWHNWQAGRTHDRRFDDSGPSREWDDVGFAYVEILAGNDTRVIRWFAQRKADEAYRKFRDLFDLLERHSVSGTLPGGALERVTRRLLRCRLQNRALLIAALRHPLFDGPTERRLMRRLAALSPTDGRRSLGVSAGVELALRALAAGDRRLARSMRELAGERRSDLHDFTSYWPMGPGATAQLLSAVATAALRGTPPHLMDLAPSELWRAVPASVRARGPKAFAVDLEERLAAPRHGDKRRRREPELSGESRERARSALAHRITPLLPHVRRAWSLVRAAPRERPALLLTALEELQRDVEAASEYPYQDGRGYLARTVFGLLFDVAEAASALRSDTALAIVEWLKRTPGFSVPVLTDLVVRLSRTSDLHDAALELASHVEGLLLRDTNTGSRISAYGELARAVWRVGLDEAGVYFRRGLELADAVGSEDFERTNQLLAITAQHRGPHLSPKAAHDLARIFELNQGEDGRFPWIEYAQSVVPIAGGSGLATISRLDDREVAELGLSLSPMLAVLVERGELPADLATCVVGIEKPIESWTWRLASFATAAVGALPPERREWLFHTLLAEIDRAAQLAPAPDGIHPLADLAREHLPPGSPSRGRLEALAERRPRDAERVETPAKPQAPAAACDDLGDPDAIDRCIERDVDGEDRRRWPRRTLAALATQANTPALRLRFVEAVAESSSSGLEDKILALQPLLAEWARRSPALRERLPSVAQSLARRHAGLLTGGSWEAHLAWRELTTHYGAAPEQLVTGIISGLGPEGLRTTGDGWLALAAQLAPRVAPEALRMGLERYLDLAGATLPDEVGDGPYSEHFAPAPTAEDTVAGLIWSRLGDPKAASRWRAAHAVRRLSEANRFDVIDRLIALTTHTEPSAFRDAKRPFYPLHAKLWLLIALARIAKDDPVPMSRHLAFLEAVAFDPAFPHVAMQHFAALALREVATILPADERQRLSERAGAVNRSPFTAVAERRLGRKDRSLPDKTFRLDYDFDKYQVTELSAAFHVPGDAVRLDIDRWVRTWDPTIDSMYDCPRIAKSDYGTGSWSGGSPPEVDRYGSYLGWHALMLVAGEYLAKHPVVADSSWKSDRWAYFLERWSLSCSDGYWMSDATDLAPIDLVTDVSMPATEAEGLDRRDSTILGPLIGLSADMDLQDELVIAGHWSLPNDITVSVATILAHPRTADAVALAAVTDRKFSMWLPADSEDVDWDYRGSSDVVTGWVRGKDQPDRELDRHDPYAASRALERPRPEAWVQEHAGLTASDRFARAWVAPDGAPAFRAEAWGAAGGRGDWAWNYSGERLWVTRQRLGEVLRTKRATLVGFVKAQAYLSEKARHGSGETPAFLHRVFAFTVDQNLRLKPLSRISQKTRSIISSMPQQKRLDFHQRLTALIAARRRGGPARH